MTKLGNSLRAVFTVLYMALANIIAYFGFANQYSAGTFSRSRFIEQYNSGIYQFRFLSTRSVLWLSDWLKSMGMDFSWLKVRFLQEDSDPALFFSLFLFNTVFCMGTILMMNLFLNRSKSVLGPSEKMLVLLFSASVIALSQFVITPYDGLSYFLLTAFTVVFLNYLSQSDSQTSFILLCLLMVLGTLNRETMALALAFAGALLLTEKGIGKDSILPLLILTVLFLATYTGLRSYFHSYLSSDSSRLVTNFTELQNLAGLLFWLVLMILPYSMSHTSEQVKFISIFYLFSLPYLFYCLYAGILIEVRLIVPVFLVGVMLSSLTMQRAEISY